MVRLEFSHILTKIIVIILDARYVFDINERSVRVWCEMRVHKVQLLLRERHSHLLDRHLLDILAGIAASVIDATTVQHNPENVLVLRVRQFRTPVGVDVVLNRTRFFRIIHLAKEDVGTVSLTSCADELDVLYLTDVHTVEGLGDHTLRDVSVDAGHIDCECGHFDNLLV